MIEWLIVGSLIVFGIILVVAEVVFVPGTTIVGILGLICLGIGLYKSFIFFDEAIAYSILGGTTLLFGIITYYVFTTRIWEKFSLKQQIDSKFNSGKLDGLNVGNQGVTVSSVKPIGNAEFGGKVYEVKSLGSFIEENNAVEIIKIENNTITIKPINN